MAIAWMYREDYARAGYRVLPYDDRARARFVSWQTLLPLLTLVPVGLLPMLPGRSSTFYFIGALFLSSGFLYCGVQFVVRRSNSAARRLLAASIIYLPLLFILMIVLRS